MEKGNNPKQELVTVNVGMWNSPYTSTSEKERTVKAITEELSINGHILVNFSYVDVTKDAEACKALKEMLLNKGYKDIEFSKLPYTPYGLVLTKTEEVQVNHDAK